MVRKGRKHGAAEARQATSSLALLWEPFAIKRIRIYAQAPLSERKEF